MAITEQQLGSIRMLEKEILMSIADDSEVNLFGNGVNAYEADLVMKAVLRALDLEAVELTDEEIEASQR